MKKYFVGKKVIGFVVVLLTCTILINSFNNIKYKYNAKTINPEIQKIEQFIKEFSIIPKEIREFRSNEDDFVLLNIPLNEELQRYTYNTCKKYEMDYIFVLSVFATESEFKSNAKSKNQIGKGYSIGIGQLNQNYIKWFSELTQIKNFDIYNDKHNIEGSVAVLKFYRDYWKNNLKGMSEEELWYYTLNSYNMGIEGFKKYIKNTGKLSRYYDQKVLKNKIKLEQDGGM